MSRGGTLIAFLVVVAAAPGCGEEEVPPELRPDDVLRRELGLTDADRVHRVLLTSEETEVASPDSISARQGSWVEFATGDWRVHEVRFLLDSLPPPARDFLESTDQTASPPLVDRDARFVVHFDGAPPGAYPFVVEGNAHPARGVVIVVPRP